MKSNLETGSPKEDKTTNWDERFLDLAIHISKWSKDTSTKVGAVVVGEDKNVLSIGYNGFPRNFPFDDDEQYHIRPKKYVYSEHAERNAIFNATRNGVPLQGSTIYITWIPCSDCARAIVQCGIKKVVYQKPPQIRDDWKENFENSLTLLDECKIEVVEL